MRAVRNLEDSNKEVKACDLKLGELGIILTEGDYQGHLIMKLSEGMVRLDPAPVTTWDYVATTHHMERRLKSGESVTLYQE